MPFPSARRPHRFQQPDSPFVAPRACLFRFFDRIVCSGPNRDVHLHEPMVRAAVFEPRSSIAFGGWTDDVSEASLNSREGARVFRLETITRGMHGVPAASAAPLHQFIRGEIAFARRGRDRPDRFVSASNGRIAIAIPPPYSHQPSNPNPRNPPPRKPPPTRNPSPQPQQPEPQQPSP